MRLKQLVTNYWMLLIILVIAFILRGFNIANNPPSVYGDEISFAWNAWNILHTGADEYGQFMPLQFRAFNDYKSPIPVYLLVPIFALFSMNELSLRMPIVVLATATVGMTYLLVIVLFQTFAGKTLKQTKTIALISAGLLAISPWHIHLSRGYFEATIALFFFIAAVYCFVKSVTHKNFLYAASIFFALSLYTYFTPRLMLLVFFPFLAFYCRRLFYKHKKTVVYALLLFIILCIPLIKVSLFDAGGHRFAWLMQQRLNHAIEENTKALQTAGGPLLVRRLLHNRYEVFVTSIVNDYLEHFSFNFWYLYGDNSLRYFLGRMGMFYIVELPFFLIGLWQLITKHRQLAGFLLGWLLIAPIPAALVGRSFAVRSLAMLPVPFIFTGAGIATVVSWFSSKPMVERLVAVLILLAFTLSITRYTLIYHFDYSRYAATWWGWENKATIEYARQREHLYDKIFISDFYTGAPLAYAFYTQYDPVAFRQAREHPITIADERHVIQLGKYYFGSLDLDKKRLEEGVIPSKTLYIGRPEEVDGTETIVAPDDGRVLFKIHHTQ